MEVEAAVETPLVFAGDQIRLSVTFLPPVSNSNESPPPTLLSGYAVVQGSFKLGDMLLSEPFADTRKQGIVLTKRGIEYGQAQNSGSLFAGVLDGLKHLVVAGQPERRGGDGANEGANSGNGSGLNSSGGRTGANSGRIGSGDHDEGDYPVFATSQLLLFTDLKLTEPKKFHFVVDLPPNLPPTYRSRSLQISYNLVIGFERIRLDANSRIVDSKPMDTRLFLPFRLLAKPPTPTHPHPPKFDLRHPINAPPPSLISDNYYHSDNNEHGENYGENSIDNKTSEQPEKRTMKSFIDGFLDGDNQLTRRNRSSSSISHLPGAQYTKVTYDIRRNKTAIAQLVLAKPATLVGDVLAGQIKLNRPCLHISVYLELEEQIEEPYAALAHTPLGSNNSGTNTNGASNNPNNSEPEVATAYTIYARQFQGVYGLKELPLYLPTLTSITPRLDTDQITASWSLRIEFVGLTGSAFALDEENGLLAKGQVDHEVFTCRIPIVILPPSMDGHTVAKTWKF